MTSPRPTGQRPAARRRLAGGLSLALILSACSTAEVATTIDTTSGDAVAASASNETPSSSAAAATDSVASVATTGGDDGQEAPSSSSTSESVPASDGTVPSGPASTTSTLDVEADVDESAPTSTSTSKPAQRIRLDTDDEFGFTQIIPDGFRRDETADDDGTIAYVNPQTDTRIRIYGTPKTAELTKTFARKADESSTSNSTSTATDDTTGSEDNATTTSTVVDEAPGDTTSDATNPIPIYTDEGSDASVAEYAEEVIGEPEQIDEETVQLSTTIDVGDHVVVIEVEGPAEEVEEALDDTRAGLVLRDPDPREVRLSSTVSLRVPNGFSASSSAGGWLEYRSGSQSMAILTGAGGNRSTASGSGSIAKIDPYGQPTGAQASYWLWPAVSADGRAVGEVVISANGTSFSVSIDGPNAGSVNSSLSSVIDGMVVIETV